MKQNEEAGANAIFRFGVFELDSSLGELRKHGYRVHLQQQPFCILCMLLERPGKLVTREEIQEKLWSTDTFVDFDRSLNRAVTKLRQALGDDAESPRFIETLPRRGYRLLVPVEIRSVVSSTATVDTPNVPALPSGNPSLEPTLPAVLSPSWTAFRQWAVRAVILAVGVFVLLLWLIPGGWPDRLLRRRTAGSFQSVAVLPFENLSGDPSKEYFADGMTDELITDLAELTRIRVVSRSSVMRYKGSRKPLPEIARELNVDAIVEGSVTLSELQVRITAQLIEASSDRHLWASSYERDRKDLFPIQREVAVTIAGLIRARTEAGNAVDASSIPTFTPETYELYEECRTMGRKSTEEGMSLAIKCYERVLALDPNCAAAYAGIANSYSALGLDNLPRARAAAMKAVELAPSLSEAHDALAEIKADYERDLAGAEKEYKQALALNPSNAGAHVGYATMLVGTGRLTDAVAEAKTARELDPFSAGGAIFSGMILFMAGQYDKAIEEERAALELNPEHDRAHYWWGYAYEQKGMYKKAIAEYEKVPNDSHCIFLSALGRSFSLAGDSKKAEEVRHKIEHYSGEDAIWPYDAALFYASLDDKDRAFEWLERDLKERDGWLLFLKVDPRLSSLRSDPRFHDLVRRVALPAFDPS